jgi:glycosyltransferase involved in cell wall biosynthesis
MNIAITSTPLLDSPPKTYGGLEAVAYLQAKGLAELGHKIVLFATDDSKQPPDGFHYKIGKAKGTVNCDWMQEESDMYHRIEPQLDKFDVIHSNDWFGFNYRYKAKHPEAHTLHTHHGGLSPQWWNRSTPPFKLNLVAISKWMQSVYKKQGYDSQVAYNGIDTSQYPYKKNKGDRFLFLGRISKIKGVHYAIEVAEKTGVELDVMGSTSFIDDPSYVEMIKAKSSQLGNVEFIGEVSHEEKVGYLQDAKGLLITSCFGEPFGLMTVEAFSCGTPVVALRDGALPEVVSQGVTGYICDNLDEMTEAVTKIDSLNGRDCRERVEERFTYQVMSRRYEQLYKMILEGTSW